MSHRVGVIVSCLLGLLMILTAVDGPGAQQVYRVESLWSSPYGLHLDPLKNARNEALKTHGYVWGDNLFITESAADPATGVTLPEIVSRLKETQVDLVWAWDQQAALAVKQGVPSIPVVALFKSDPVRAELVDSLARPGGSVTGISLLAPDLNGKRLQLLAELIPGAGRICVLHNPNEPGQIQWQSTNAAAGRLSVELLSLEADSPRALRSALEKADGSRCAALLVLDDGSFREKIRYIVSAAGRSSLPVMCDDPSWAEPLELVGRSTRLSCMAAYGPSFRHLVERMAEQADKILQGIPPAEVPVERPTRFELVVNLRTAQALGIKIPPSILFQANKVVQ